MVNSGLSFSKRCKGSFISSSPDQSQAMQHYMQNNVTESLNMFWTVMSEFDLNALPEAILGLMYLADLLAEGEEPGMVTERASFAIAPALWLILLVSS